MTPILTTRQYIESWHERGLITDEVAEALRADLGSASESAETAAGTPGFAGRLNAGLEALGYLGSALVIGAVLFLFDIASWPQTAIAILLFAVAGLSGFGVHRLTPAEGGQTKRLVTVLGVAGVCSLAGALMLSFAADCLSQYDRDCDWMAGRAVPLLIASVSTWSAVLLYTRVRNAATHLLMGVGAATTVWLASQSFFSPSSDAWRAHAVIGAMTLLPVAVAWIWASESGRLVPAWAGTAGASIVALTSTITLSDFDLFGSNHTSAWATVAFGAAYVTAGTIMDRWRITAVGALVLLFSLPWLLTDVLGLSATTTALVLLPLGAAMLAYVVQRTRAQSSGS